MTNLYYPDYIQLDKLLSAQSLQSEKVGKPAHDEMLFIIAHQSYELWFKQVLYELDSVLELMAGEHLADQSIPLVVSRLDRIKVIMKLMVSQVDVLETMTPMDFLEFRDCLIPASGFQSYQFRLFEIRLGFPHQAESAIIKRFPEAEQQIMKTALAADTLFKAVERWLQRMPFIDSDTFTFWESYRQTVSNHFAVDLHCLEVNPELSPGDRAKQMQGLQATQQRFDDFFDEQAYKAMLASGERRMGFRATMSALFIMLYRDYPVLQAPFQLLSNLIDIDDLLTQWRHRHAHLAKRMIGSRVGTGGSAGTDYLQSTVKNKVFEDINQLTVYLLARAALPALPEDYREQLGFHF